MSTIKEKELRKWSTGRRRKIFKNRLKTSVSNIVDTYLKEVSPDVKDAHKLKTDLMEIAVNSVSSKKFKELIEPR